MTKEMEIALEALGNLTEEEFYCYLLESLTIGNEPVSTKIH